MIRRCPRPTTGFYVISNEVSSDPRLSWPARGMLTYLLAKPDHWAVSVANLVNQTAEAVGIPSGRDAVYTVLRELMITRYIKRVQKRREDGTMAGVEYIVSEMPFAEEKLGDDFLTKQQVAARRRRSLAARNRSFCAVSEPEVADSLVQEAARLSASPDVCREQSSSIDPGPPTSCDGPVNSEPDVRGGQEESPPGPNSITNIDVREGGTWAAGEERQVTPPEAFSPLTDHPEAVQPDTVDTTQATTHLKKEPKRSKDSKAPARKRQPKPRSTGKAPVVELFDAATLVARGVDPQVAATWMAVRAKKRAFNSMLALDGVQEEADLAGMSLAQAIKLAARRSWQGFEAKWVKRDDAVPATAARRPRSGAQMTEDELAESMRKAKAELFGDTADFGTGNGREPTLLDREGDLWRAPS